MTGDMRDILERELRQHAAALRGLARDLVGAGDADDVVQETALQALRTPPARAGALGGWLAGIVRHVASRHRRSEARRLRREQVAAREPIAEEAPTDDGDTLRLLTEAVLALPQPYRAAVFARYLKGLEPAQIAAQTREPLGTIKTRLVRGLALLRERFDARERERGGDWRAAFAGAFGLERMTAATTVTAGVFVMTATMKWALGAVTAAIVVVSAFVLAPPGSSAAGPAPATEDPLLAQASVPGSALAAPQVPAAAPAVTERTPAETATMPAPTEAAACIVRGRCVDEAGAPRPGVHAMLDGRGGNLERIARWKQQHGEPPQVDQRTETGADGAFVFRLAESPLAFDLELGGRGIASWRCSWTELAAGTTDLGDVVLARGTLLRGRVVDADGAPVPKTDVSIERVPRDVRDRGPRQQAQGWTRQDGSFAMRPSLSAGDYKLEVAGQLIERPAGVVLTGEPEQFVDVVLKRLTEADAISGLVVDEEGAPIRGAMVAPMLNGSVRNTSTDAEGRFRVLRRETMPDRVALWVIADGYEVPLVRETFAWGRTDLRFVATKGKGLVVQVVRASDGAPIEDFMLRVAPFGGGRQSSFDLRPHEPPHANGRVAVSGVRCGRHHVIVEPGDATLAIGVVPIEVTASGAPPVTVRLAATMERTVRVQRADGSPVCDASVQLVDPLGEPLAERTNVRAPREWQGYTGTKALVLAAAVTDARGEARLLAPGDRALGLRLPGPAHVPHTVPNAVFPDDGPLVVTVQTGATLRGTIGPEAAFAEIRRLARIDATERPTSSAWPWIQLWRRDAAGASEHFPDLRTRCSLAKDGTFELIGVPPGRWRIVVKCLVANDRGDGRWLEEDGGFVDLAAGGVVSRTIDLATMLPGELEGVVLHNGAPLADAPVQLRMRLADHPDKHPYHVEDVATDTAGRFRARIRAGEYELVWMPVRAIGSWVTVQVVAAERGRVEVGKRTEQTFSLATGLVHVLLLDPSGKPARNVVLQCRDAGDVERFLFAPTDAEGRTKTECNIAPFTMFVLPRRLQDPAAAEAHRQARLGQPDPFADVQLAIGRFMPRAGETVTVELRLPPEWEH